MSEWVIKFNGLSGDNGQRGPYSSYKPCNHWNHVKQKMKIKLCRASVKSVLLYNCNTRGVPSSVEQCRAFHRRQLRRILGIKFPTTLSNKQLYEKTGEKSISSIMRKARRELFGYILKQDIPAYKAMSYISCLWQQRDLEASQKSTPSTEKWLKYYTVNITIATASS